VLPARQREASESELHPEIPRVYCPTCGELLRLIRIVPLEREKCNSNATVGLIIGCLLAPAPSLTLSQFNSPSPLVAAAVAIWARLKIRISRKGSNPTPLADACMGRARIAPASLRSSILPICIAKRLATQAGSQAASSSRPLSSAFSPLRTAAIQRHSFEHSGEHQRNRLGHQQRRLRSA
jgi:hypothetical protein